MVMYLAIVDLLLLMLWQIYVATTITNNYKEILYQSNNNDVVVVVLLVIDNVAADVVEADNAFGGSFVDAVDDVLVILLNVPVVAVDFLVVAVVYCFAI